LTNEAIERLLHTEILKQVSKPGRYLGNEHNIIKKSWDEGLTRIALAFPDVYDTAMPYNGFQILYHLLNREVDISAERVYAPWPDMESELRKHQVPLFSLESKHGLAEFDIVGFSLPYDLLYTNILNMLDLAGIPIWTKDRTANDPFVIAGGTNAYNPEPVADFFDMIFIGDAEELVVDLVRIIGDGRRLGRSRVDILAELATLREGIYVPEFYDVDYDDENRVTAVTPNRADVPERVQSAKIPHLAAENYPVRPVVPLVDIAQDRFAIEVFRGCTQGCRFCHAGMVYRPVRERDPEELVQQAMSTLEATGQENLAFLSLSTSDYTGLGATMKGLKEYVQAKKISVNFPSMRLDTFTNEIATYAKQTKKSGLTFAPEAGTWRMRRVINKLISDEDLRDSVTIALKEGWKTLKFYFMLGLPTETEADLQGIVDLITEVLELAKPYGSVQVNVTLSTFIPKPETPFQWEAQDDKETIQAKIDFLMERLRIKRVKASYRNPRYSEIEGILSRGDRRLSAAIYHAWEQGAKFDSWGDFFNYDLWLESFARSGLDAEFYLRERDVDEFLPWDHIDNRLLKKFLKRERRKSYQEATVIDCRDGCLACGVCDFEELTMRIVKDGNVPQETNTVIQDSGLLDQAQRHVEDPVTSMELPEEVFTARIRYQKLGLASFLGHLDVNRAFLRAIMMAELPVVYSQGFSRKPRISTGPALPLGYTSDVEYLDIQLAAEVEGVGDRLNLNLPEGLIVIEETLHPGRLASLSGSITEVTHIISFDELDKELSLQMLKADFTARENVYITRRRKGREIEIDLKDYIKYIDIDNGQLIVTTRVQDGKGVRMNELMPMLFNCRAEELPVHTVHRKSIGVKELDPSLQSADF